MSIVQELQLEEAISKLIQEKLNPGILDEVKITVNGHEVEVDFTRLEDRSILYFVTKENFNKHGILLTNSSLTRIQSALLADTLANMPAATFFRTFFGCTISVTKKDGETYKRFGSATKSLEEETALGRKTIGYLRDLLHLLLFEEATMIHMDESEAESYFALEFIQR